MDNAGMRIVDSVLGSLKTLWFLLLWIGGPESLSVENQLSSLMTPGRLGRLESAPDVRGFEAWVKGFVGYAWEARISRGVASASVDSGNYRTRSLRRSLSGIASSTQCRSPGSSRTELSTGD